MKSLNFKLLLIIFCVLLVSCSFNSNPDISLGKEAVQKEISKKSPVNLTVSSFTKTNGIEREYMGRNIYTMEYTAELRVDQKCWHLRSIKFLEGFHYMDDFADYQNVYYSGSSKTIFNEGAIISFNGKIDFEKTEQGWREIGCALTNFNIVSNPLSEENIEQSNDANNDDPGGDVNSSEIILPGSPDNSNPNNPEKISSNTTLANSKESNDNNSTQKITFSQVFGTYVGISETIGSSVNINSDKSIVWMQNGTESKGTISLMFDGDDLEYIKNKAKEKLGKEIESTGYIIEWKIETNKGIEKGGFMLLKTSEAYFLWGGGDVFFEKNLMQ